MRCDEPLASPLVCTTCRTVFPAAAEYDHFVRFGVARRYDLDLADVERRYLVLSRGLHPDQFAGRSREERQLAEQLTAHVNDAYAILRDPMRRAEYLLELEGGPLRAQEKKTPPGFLVEMLEANERIEEAEGHLDDATRAELDTMRAGLRSRRDAILQEIGKAFSALPPRPDPPRPEPVRASALTAIREKLNAAAYLQGLATQITDLLLR
ncbi:MAG TPA: Fe-S protein assembly co-chaperone HscB [Planctomycetota bacterium]|nr:Fe-S protein assembly co-chaperone HscB [Planctomycetota bacterium]